MATIDRKITHNIHGAERTCSRCGSKPTMIKVKSDYLCDICQLKRIERQRQNRTFVHKKCKCGQRIGQSHVECYDCAEKAIINNELDACETVEELKDFIRNHLL